MRSLRFLSGALVGAAGAAAAFLMDPQNGRRRRAQAIDRTTAMARRTARMATRASRAATAEIEGRSQALRHAMAGASRPVANEETLADRVRSELFRDGGIPKGNLNVNVERDCVVVLRGEVRPELIGGIERRVRSIPGVRDVENLLHAPGTPAAMHT